MPFQYVLAEYLWIEQQLIQPQLATEDWLGAVDAAADGLQDAAGGGSGTGSAAPGSGFPLGLVIFLVIAAVAILVIVVVVRRRRKNVGGAGPGRQVEQVSVEELSRRTLEQELQAKEREVERLLLEADNRRKTGELEAARELQLSLLPAGVPEVAGLRVAAAMTTATEVGGDY